MKKQIFGDHTSKHIHFYIIYDTNWLMKRDGGYKNYPKVLYPKVLVASESSWFSSPEFFYILLPVAVIVPVQVKREIAKLHDEKTDHAKTSNAKRSYSVLQKHFNKQVKPYLRVRYEEMSYEPERFDNELFAFHESDLETVPKMKMFEDVLGPDSEVDKGIVSLARAICSIRPTNHCFIATCDTGIQTEASHLFYRKKENIGCTSYLEEWVSHVDSSAKEIVEQKKECR